MQQTYSFRIRINRCPWTAIETDEVKIPLAGDPLTDIVWFTSRGASDAIRDADQLVLFGPDFYSREDADRAGRAFETALLIALARIRVGADFGQRAVDSVLTSHGLRWLEEQRGERVLNDAHGLMVYEAHPDPKFVLPHSTATRAVNRQAFVEAFRDAVRVGWHLSGRERLAFDLFNSAFFQPTPDSKFLLLVMAIEALIEPSARSQEAQEHVRLLVSLTKSAKISEHEKASMLGSIRWLSKDSISAAGKKLAATRLHGRTYAGRTAAELFAHAYQVRSNLVHGNLPYPTVREVSELADLLERFVSELLTSPSRGVPC
jgi:hypothetical protein